MGIRQTLWLSGGAAGCALAAFLLTRREENRKHHHDPGQTDKDAIVPPTMASRHQWGGAVYEIVLSCGRFFLFFLLPRALGNDAGLTTADEGHGDGVFNEEDGEENEGDEAYPIEELGEDFGALAGASHRGEVSKRVAGLILRHEPKVRQYNRRERRHQGDLAEDCKGAMEEGMPRIFVKTFGCGHNTADSEVMLGQLLEQGYTLSSSLEDSDLCLLNSCTVKNPSEHTAMSLVQQARKLGKRVVLAGCVPSGTHPY